MSQLSPAERADKVLDRGSALSDPGDSDRDGNPLRSSDAEAGCDAADASPGSLLPSNNKEQEVRRPRTHICPGKPTAREIEEHKDSHHSPCVSQASAELKPSWKSL